MRGLEILSRTAARMRPAYLMDRHFRSWDTPVGTMMVRICGMLVNFGVLALTARWAGQESLGLVIAVNAGAFLGGSICAVGIPTLLLKTMTGHFLSGEADVAAGHYFRGLRIVFAASAVITFLASVVASSQACGWLPSTLGSIGPIECIALGVCSAGTAVQFVTFSAIRALKRPAVSGLLQFCTPPLLLFCALGFLKATTQTISPRAAVLALTCSIVFNALLAHLVVVKGLPRKTLSQLESMLWDKIKPFWVLGVLSAASSNVLLLLASFLLDPLQVALIGVPFRICNLPMTVVAALGAYYAPVIREAFLQRKPASQKRELIESQWIGTLLVLPVFLAAIAAPSFFLGLFQIHDPLAVQLFRLFAFAQVVIAGCGVCEQYLAMIDEAEMAAKITTIIFLSMLAVVCFFLIHYGALMGGCAWAVLAVTRQLLLRSRCH